MLKKILVLLTTLLIAFSFASCSASNSNKKEDSTSVSEEKAELVDWKQGIAPDFNKKYDSKHSFEKQEAYNGKSYNMTFVSFADCTQDDFASYGASLEKAGFKLNGKESNESIKYYFDAAGNMVVAGFSKGYLSITVGTPAK